MGRKKKKVITEEHIEQPAKEEPSKLENVSLAGTQTFGYQGKITVKVQHGNKIIKTKEYHNNGTPLLFKFLCLALAGKYSDFLRPCKVKLFFFPGADGEQAVSPKEFDWQTEFSGTNCPRGATPFILYDTTPILERKHDPERYQVTFHFRIPFAMINDNVIHMVGFYPNNTFPGNEIDASAYYLFVDDSGENWAPIELENITGNFSIILDWTMAVMNKPETNN